MLGQLTVMCKYVCILCPTELLNISVFSSASSTNKEMTY